MSESVFRPIWLWRDAHGYLERGFWEEIPESAREGAACLSDGSEFVVRGDIRPGFNVSAGCWIGSREERREVMKREGLRPVEISDPAAALAAHERRRSEAIRNPKVTLAESHYEVFQAAGGDRKDVRRMLEESERGGDATMERRWQEGRVRR